MFRSGTQLVDLFVTVTDRNGRLVPDLLREDFEVFDDGRPAEIVLFENDVRPITVVVMLDTSASMDLNRRRLMAGAEQFLIRMLPFDRARVGAFNDKVEIEPAEFIGDRDELISWLSRLDFGNATRVYDAAATALEALSDVPGRRVVLLFTDGDDTDSDASSRDVLNRAIADEVMIYSIGFESNYFNGARFRHDSSGQKPAAVRGRDRRRLLRADRGGRSGAHVHARGPGAAQPVRHRLHAGGGTDGCTRSRCASSSAGCRRGARRSYAAPPATNDGP